jgi:Predicted nucleotide-binding protein containing TIR-like domain
MKAKMFIASSKEHLDLAYAAQEGLEHDVEATVWSQGIFTLSKSTMASLIDALDDNDFGLFILAPSDPNDCITLIESWMRRRPSSNNTAAIRYDDVDRELRLAPGSARTYIEQAARRWHYIPARKGKDTIIFKDAEENF